MSKTVSVKWTPEPKDGPVLDMANIRIELDEDNPDKVWIKLLDVQGDLVEGGTFDKGAFMDVILKFYLDNF